MMSKTPIQSDALAALRVKIDQLDQQLLTLLNERASVAQEVGHIKRAEGSPFFRPDRVAQVIQQITHGNPGPLHNDHVVSERQLLQGAVRRRQALKAGSSLPLETATWHAQAQPLLAAWGQQGRDFLHLLDLHDDVERYRHVLGRIDVFDDPAPQDAPASRLQRLQSDILHLDPLPETRHPVLPQDDSIVFVREARNATRRDFAFSSSLACTRPPAG